MRTAKLKQSVIAGSKSFLQSQNAHVDVRQPELHQHDVPAGSPTLDLPLSGDFSDQQNENITVAAVAIAALASEVASPLTHTSSISHSDSDLSTLSAERTAALH